MGQRILSSSGPELGLLEVREILLQPTGEAMTDRSAT
jgi:hypothetical protein